MKYMKTIIAGATIMFLCAALVARPIVAWEHPPETDPHDGWGHHMFGEDGDFFVTASGNVPYITFHVSGNTSLESVYRVMIEKLIFFTDTDMDGKYNRSVDTITQQLALSTLTWTIGNLSFNNGAFNATLNTTAPGTFSQLKIVVHYNNNTSSNSTMLKFDIIVVNMNLAAYNGGDHVAFENKLIIEIDNDGNGTHRFINGTGTDDDSILISPTTNPADRDVKFSWVENAWLNGTTRPHACNGTARDDSNETEDEFFETVYLAFPRFVNLTYDPTIELTPLVTTTPPPAIPGYDTLILVAGIAVTSGLIACTKRRALAGGRNKE